MTVSVTVSGAMAPADYLTLILSETVVTKATFEDSIKLIGHIVPLNFPPC